MSVTVTIMLAFWLASSYIEYKLIKSFPAGRKWIQHPIGGIILSLIIGAGVSFFVGSAGGVGVFLGQLLGLSTNNFTYKLYSGLAQVNTAWKSFAENMKHTWQQNKEAMVTVIESFKTLFRGIASVFMAIIWVLSLPGRIANFFSRGNYAKSL